MSTAIITLDPQAVGPATGAAVPVLIANSGDRAGRRFLEFFTASIRNPNTRAG